MANWQEGDPLTPTNLNSHIPSWVSSSAGAGVISPTNIIFKVPMEHAV